MPGPMPASRAIAAATVGRSDAATWSSLYVRCRMVRSDSRSPHTAVLPVMPSQISSQAFSSSAGTHPAGTNPCRPSAIASRASTRR